jgi:8-hydroxy-5-deazaflavin:NADPH oxidoreductase
MEVLIVGAGNMGGGIGTRVIGGGHTLRITDKDLSKAQKLAAFLNGDATAQPLTDGANRADVVVLALPYPAGHRFAAEWADRLAGKVVVDVANPIDFQTLDALTTPPGKSAAQQVAEAAPQAKVVKAFNTCFARNLSAGAPLDVLIAGDDERACGLVGGLAADGGLRPVLVGGLKHAGTLEGMQLLHIKVQEQIGGDWQTAIMLVSNKPL